MSNSKLLSAEIRNLAKKYRTGKHDSPKAFRELISFILNLTVLKRTEVIQLQETSSPDFFVVGRTFGATDAVRLNDGRYLRLTITVRRTSSKADFIVEKLSYQYQLDRKDNHRWIFRYDYQLAPSPESSYPSSHLQLNAKVPHDVGTHRDMHKIHFPVGKVSLVSILRLLADEYHVPCNNLSKIWDPVLIENQALLLEMGL